MARLSLELLVLGIACAAAAPCRAAGVAGLLAAPGRTEWVRDLLGFFDSSKLAQKPPAAQGG